MEGYLSSGPQKADKDEENKKMNEEIPGIRFETDAIHVGQEPERWPGQAVVPPISLATTFKQLEPGKPVLYEYSRCGNPTRQCLEECLASLEKAKYALTFSSGLGATTTLMFMLKSGDHIVSIDDVYGGTGRLFRFVSFFQKKSFQGSSEFIDVVWLKWVLKVHLLICQQIHLQLLNILNPQHVLFGLNHQQIPYLN
jgi:cystathionine gamma-lyase